MKAIANHNPDSFSLSYGEGCYLFDDAGKRYLDFSAGWCVGSIGWGNKKVAEAIKKEADRDTFVPPSVGRPGEEEFAEFLAAQSPEGKLKRVFRCTSGSEAVEFAIKCARAATGKKTIVSVSNVYHGHTFGAATVGNACTPKMQPCVPGFLKVPLPDSFRGVTGEAVIAQFSRLLESEDGGDIAAFLSEPVWTNAGAVIPPPDFYVGIENLCRAHGALLIMDEVATGCGRCGTMFGSELWGIKPDIMCLGKGFTGGYATMAATLVTEEVYEKSRGIPSYSTFGWLAQDLAATRAVFDIITRERLWENAAEVGKFLLDELKPLEGNEKVGEVRGTGLVLGIEIVKDSRSKEADQAGAERIMEACREKGLIIETAGNTLFITPPLILTKEQAKEGAAIIIELMS